MGLGPGLSVVRSRERGVVPSGQIQTAYCLPLVSNQPEPESYPHLSVSGVSNPGHGGVLTMQALFTPVQH